MATATIPIKLSKNPLNTRVYAILDSVKDSRGFYLWPDLVEQLELHFGLTQIQAAVEIRTLVNLGIIFQVPCHLTSELVFSLDRTITKSDVYATEADELQFKEQNVDYLKKLCANVEHQKRKRTDANRQGLFDKQREAHFRK